MTEHLWLGVPAVDGLTWARAIGQQYGITHAFRHGKAVCLTIDAAADGFRKASVRTCSRCSQWVAMYVASLRQVAPEGSRAIMLTGNRFALVDQEDFERLAVRRWSIHHGYAVSNKLTACTDKRRGMLHMHREVIRAAEGLEVDHINHDTLDNRKANLRPVTLRQNQFNRRLTSRNSSGYKGVSWHKRDRVWVAGIRAHGSRIHLGVFNSPQAAAEAYDKAAQKHFGALAFLNFPAPHSAAEDPADA